MSGKLSIPCKVSILAMIAGLLVVLFLFSISARQRRISFLFLIKENEMISACFTAKSRSSSSFSVITGSLSLVPGKLRPLSTLNLTPLGRCVFVTRTITPSSATDSTLPSITPSSYRTRLPTFRLSRICANCSRL